MAILVVALAALAVRAPRLRLRPMHTDEAVHADKFGTLLEGGSYRYEPNEYHGPTLNYFTLIPAWLSGADTYAEITEATVRIVPVVFGVLLILLTLLIADGLGLAAVPAAALMALSPALVFYSRYYIQEMLLVCFTFGVIVCGYRYARSRAWPWAVLTGVCAGLMHATKETALIAFGALGLALVLSCCGSVRSDAVRRYVFMPLRAHYEHAATRQGRGSLSGVRPLHLALGVAAALAVSALFYSSFLGHPSGVLDSYRAYATYFGRAGGAGTVHVHPWHYYLRILLFARYYHGPVWTEGWIVLLALAGLVAAVKGSRVGPLDAALVRFLALYTVILTVIYSAVPYKTPWCLLGFLHGLILLAGVGAVSLLAWARRPAWQALTAALLVAAAAHLGLQAYRASFVYQTDSRNPYVYAHPTQEILVAVEKVRDYAGTDGLGYSDEMPIQVAVPGGDYWPLPWYLRDLPAVGYGSVVPEEVGPLILISDALEGALTRKLYVQTPPQKRQMYMYLFDEPYYVWSRPGVKLLGFVRKDLWDRQARRQDAAQLIEGQRDGQAPTTGTGVRNQ